MAIQGHWLHSEESGYFSSIGEDVCICSVSVIKTDLVISGRPCGGVAVYGIDVFSL